METHYYIEQKRKSELWQIFLVVTDSRLEKPVKYYSGLRIKKKSWDRESQKGNGSSFNGLNSDLKILAAHAVAAWSKLEKEDRISSDNLYNEIALLDGKPHKVRHVNSDLIKHLERYILLAKVGEEKNGVVIKRKTERGKDYSPGTISWMESFKNCMVKFEKETAYKLEWRNINDVFYEKFTSWLWDEMDNQDSVVGFKISFLKTFIDWCVDEKILSRVLYTSKWKVWSEPDADCIALMPEEIKLLYKMPIKVGDYFRGVMITEEKADLLDKIRKRYIAGCLTLLRPGDLSLLTEQDIIIQGGAWHLNLIQDKTDKPILIRLHEVVIEIIQEYRKQHTTLFPPLRPDEYIDYLKDLGHLFRVYLNSLNLENKIVNNWNDPFVRTSYKRGKPIRRVVDMCDKLTPHTQRATGATTLLILGMREFEVKKLGGWAKESRSFGRYIRMVQRYIDAQSNSTWDKLELNLKVS